jgi:hypothetical protein
MFRLDVFSRKGCRWILLIAVLPLVFGSCIAGAQALPTVQSGGVVRDSQSGIPEDSGKGLTLSSALNVAHDSTSGWSTLVSPSLSYRFNPVFSVDASVPYYASLNGVRTTKKGVTKLTEQSNELGDTALNGHLEFHPLDFDYVATTSVTFPTGDIQLGLSTGKVSYNVNNHLEHDLGIFTPDVEVGIGTTSGLFRQQVRTNYTSSGLLAFFQAGTSIDLPATLGLDVEGYEQLPIGAQTVYSRTTRKNGTVLTDTSSAEDNGFSVELTGNLLRNVVLGTSFNRSVRLNDSSEGFSLTFLLHVPPEHEVH